MVRQNGLCASHTFLMRSLRNVEVDSAGAPTPNPTAAPTVAPTAAPTVAPTAAPTAAPTPAPTMHECDDGNHGCDQGPGGICVKDGAGWKCECAAGYMCTAGCDNDHTGHTCVATAAPTPDPTAAPTGAPPHQAGSRTQQKAPKALLLGASWSDKMDYAHRILFSCEACGT